MNKIYNMDALEFLNTLSGIPLQIHDIPYFIEPNTKSIENTTSGTGIIRDFGGWDLQNVDFIKFSEACSKAAAIDSNVLVFYNNWYHISYLVEALAKHFDTVDVLVWYKTNPKPQIRKRQFVNNHELIVWARRGKHTLNFSKHADMYSIRKNSLAIGKDRLKVINESGKRVNAHPTQKPVKLVQYYIEKLSNPGDVVVDAYAGVLTTAIAALRSDRNFIVNELNKEYIKHGLDWVRTEIRDVELIES